MSQHTAVGGGRFRAVLALAGLVACGEIAPLPGAPFDPTAAPTVPTATVDPVATAAPTPTTGPVPPEEEVVYGIVGTGQSLSVGARASNAIYPAIPVASAAGRHWMLTGLRDGRGDVTAASTWQLSSLADPMRGAPAATAWPNNVFCQSPHSAIAAALTAKIPGIQTVHTVVGQSGQPMKGIQKGGDRPSYAGSISETARIAELLRARGVRFEVLAVVLTHGESDYGSKTYGDELLRLQQDYDQDLRAITGQRTSIPLVMTQPSAGWPTPAEEASNIPQVMLDAVRAHPQELALVGPKTGLAYAGNDFHLAAEGTVELGTQIGDFLAERLLHPDASTEPFAPKEALFAAVSTETTEVKITLNRPVTVDRSLFGTTHSTRHTGWQNGLGFEAKAANGTELPITDVVVTGDQARITVAGNPAEISYTLFGDGPGTIRRGALRDDRGRWLVQFRLKRP
jgi:hypothetical protein